MGTLAQRSFHVHQCLVLFHSRPTFVDNPVGAQDVESETILRVGFVEEKNLLVHS